MPITKAQALNFLNTQKSKSAIGSSKYLAMGVFRILVTKDLVTPAEIMTEFPEYAQIDRNAG